MKFPFKVREDLPDGHSHGESFHCPPKLSLFEYYTGFRTIPAERQDIVQLLQIYFSAETEREDILKEHRNIFRTGEVSWPDITEDSTHPNITVRTGIFSFLDSLRLIYYDQWQDAFLRELVQNRVSDSSYTTVLQQVLSPELSKYCLAEKTLVEVLHRLKVYATTVNGTSPTEGIKQDGFLFFSDYIKDVSVGVSLLVKFKIVTGGEEYTDRLIRQGLGPATRRWINMKMNHGMAWDEIVDYISQREHAMAVSLLEGETAQRDRQQKTKREGEMDGRCPYTQSTGETSKRDRQHSIYTGETDGRCPRRDSETDRRQPHTPGMADGRQPYRLSTSRVSESHNSLLVGEMDGRCPYTQSSSFTVGEMGRRVSRLDSTNDTVSDLYCTHHRVNTHSTEECNALQGRRREKEEDIQPRRLDRLYFSLVVQSGLVCPSVKPRIPVVRGRINGTECEFILNAGTDVNIITERAQKVLKIQGIVQKTGRTVLYTIDGVREIESDYVSAIVQIGEMESISKQKFLIVPNKEILVILGIPWIRNNYVAYIGSLVPPDRILSVCTGIRRKYEGDGDVLR